LVANRLPKVGQVRLAHILTHRGGIRSELTITRLDDDRFYVVTPGWAEKFDEDFLVKALPIDGAVKIKNITTDIGCFVITGPRSRKLLQQLTDADLGNDAFPWFTAKKIVIEGVGHVRAIRVSYVGELGWELHHNLDQQNALYELLFDKGSSLGLKPIGMRAIDSLRLEKSYRGWNLDLSSEYSPIESGLDRFAALDKGDFRGREALVKQKKNGIKQKMVTLEIDDCEVQPIVNAPLYEHNRMVGRITSGGYGHTLKKVLALAYLDITDTKSKHYQAEILGQRYPAKMIDDSPYDPENKVQSI